MNTCPVTRPRTTSKSPPTPQRGITNLDPGLEFAYGPQLERQRAVLEMILNSGSSVSVGIPCCVSESSMFTKPTLLIHFEIPDAHVTHALRLTSHSSLTESASKRDVVERRGPRCLSIVVIAQRLLFIICSFPPDSDQLGILGLTNPNGSPQCVSVSSTPHSRSPRSRGYRRTGLDRRQEFLARLHCVHGAV
jgi:hypothetical protein